MLSQVLTREIVYSTQFLDTPRVKGVIKKSKPQSAANIIQRNLCVRLCGNCEG